MTYFSGASGTNTDVAAFDAAASAMTTQAASRLAEGLARVVAGTPPVADKWSTIILGQVVSLNWTIGSQT
jgi:hypothetical protein